MMSLNFVCLLAIRYGADRKPLYTKCAMVVYKNVVPIPFIYMYCKCLNFRLAVNIYNVVLNLRTWCTSVIGAPCNPCIF